MKKIAFIIGSMVGGGAERVISVISEMYAEDNYDIHLIVFRKTDNLYYISPKVKIHYLSENEGRIKRNIKLPVELAKKMRMINADVYISFCILENCMSCISNIFVRKELVISERNAPKNERLSLHLRVMRKLFYRVADGIIFQTQEAKECYPQSIQAKSVVIPNPIKDNLPEKTDYNKRNKIVAVGRLTFQKNYPMLLKAFSIVFSKHPEYELFIYGKGPLENELKRLSIDLNVESSVHFMGFTNNVHEAIIDADMYIMSSNYEGMPNALMEAMAIGIPSISTDCPSGGPRVLISNGVNGILVPVKDDIGLSTEMNRLIEESDTRINIGNNSKQLKQEYSREAIYKLWEKYTSRFFKQEK